MPFNVPLLLPPHHCGAAASRSRMPAVLESRAAPNKAFPQECQKKFVCGTAARHSSTGEGASGTLSRPIGCENRLYEKFFFRANHGSACHVLGDENAKTVGNTGVLTIGGTTGWRG